MAPIGGLSQAGQRNERMRKKKGRTHWKRDGRPVRRGFRWMRGAGLEESCRQAKAGYGRAVDGAWGGVVGR
jgi:hypothetical protein